MNLKNLIVPAFLIALVAFAVFVSKQRAKPSERPYHHRYSTSFVVTGAVHHTNSDGSRWSELLGTSQPATRERVYEDATPSSEPAR